MYATFFSRLHSRSTPSDSERKKKLFGSKFILPVKGRLSGVFGSQRILNSKPRSPHYGIDIAQKEGTPIIAPSSGKVKLVDYGMFFTGNTVVVDHGLGLISIFAHLQDIFVTEGQYLKIGEKIGTVGMTGRATGPHLHWGIYLEKKPGIIIFFIFCISFIFLNLSILEKKQSNFFETITLTLTVFFCYIIQYLNFKNKKSYKSIFDFSAYVGAIITIVIFLQNHL